MVNGEKIIRLRRLCSSLFSYINVFAWVVGATNTRIWINNITTSVIMKTKILWWYCSALTKECKPDIVGAWPVSLLSTLYFSMLYYCVSVSWCMSLGAISCYRHKQRFWQTHVAIQSNFALRQILWAFNNVLLLNLSKRLLSY